ncbi:MAG: GMP/IMP nucleotidase [Gammaproteobacteria bacterium]
MPAAKFIPDWPGIQSVFLDMDGTLLDLHFDNYFWREHVPLRYGERHGMSPAAAKAELLPRFRQVQGTLQWYCVDYWSRELGMDILGLKRELENLIRMLPHAQEFLQQTRTMGKQLVLLTNAHAEVLSLKMQRTGLERYFDRIVSAHALGSPKESGDFWHALHALEPFDVEGTLFVDDSLPVLRAARDYGIRNLIAMRRPDSHQATRTIDEFPSVESLAELMP